MREPDSVYGYAARIAIAALTAEPSINIQFINGWPVLRTIGVISKSLPIRDGFHDFYTVPPKVSAVPDGYCIMPLKLTAKNGAKAALIGEFHTEIHVGCDECGGCGCYDCDDTGSVTLKRDIDWSTIKAIYAAAVSVCRVGGN